MNENLRNIFREVHGTYQLVNHLLTLGLDIRWRRRAARIASAAGGSRWLDICTGTGDMARALHRLAGKGTRIYAADFSNHMLEKAREKTRGNGVFFTLSDAASLPFGDDTFDLAVISFSTRNINRGRDKLCAAFREFRRVLRPGGYFINLETSQPDSELVRWFFHLYVRIFVRPVGTAFSGSSKGYAYLSRTIPEFYGREELADILRSSGFERVDCAGMTMGAVAVHTARKGLD